MCSISVVNLDPGEIEHKMVLEGIASEIYDVCMLEGARKPHVVDLESDALNTMFRPSKLYI